METVWIGIITGVCVVAGLIIYHLVRAEKLMRRLFRQFLAFEKTAPDFMITFLRYFTENMRRYFHAEGCMLFLVNQNRVSSEVYSFGKGKASVLKKYLNNKEFDLTENDKNRIRNCRIDKNCVDKMFFEGFSKYRGQVKTVTLPIYQEDRLTAFYVFQFFGIFWNFVANLSIRRNRFSFAEMIQSIIVVMKQREQSIISIMMDNIRDYAFISSDNELTITGWNKGAQIMFGYEANEIIGKTVYYLVSKDNSEDFKRAVFISTKKEETTVKISMVDYNTTEIASEVLLKQMRINDIPTGYYILIKDISKDEVLKNNMRNKSLINKSIVENARDGIILLNKEDRIIYYNEKIKNIADNKFTVLGLDIINIFPRQYGTKIKEKITELKATNIEFNYMDINVGEFWYNIRFFPTKSETGDYQGVIIFFIDNTIRMKDREEIEEKKDQLEKMNQRLLENLLASRTMQLSLIPHSLLKYNHIQFESTFILCDEVGGDFYYVEELRLDKKSYYMMLISDVSGHGVEASMFSVLVKDSYSDYKKSLTKPEDIMPSDFLKVLNSKIFNLEIESEKFITAFFVILDIASGQLQYASAGHPSMMIIRDEETILSYSIKNAPPVGVKEKFDYKSDTVQVKKGDKLVLYTDGLLDLFSGDKSYHAFFNQFLIMRKKQTIEELKADVEKEAAKRLKEQHYYEDDITVIYGKIL